MIVDAALYVDGRRVREPFAMETAERASRADNAFCWIGLFEPQESEFDEVRTEFGLHELAVEDAVDAHQRPKLEIYDDTLFVVLKPVHYDTAVDTLAQGEILLFVSPDLLVAVRHGAVSKLVDVRRRLEQDPEELKLGPGAVLLEIIDRVVDDYAMALAAIESDIHEVEEQVFSDDDSSPTERIYRLKRHVIALAQAVVPLLEPLERLTRGRYEAIDPALRDYYRDTLDNLTRVSGRVMSLTDLLTSILEANLTQVSVRQNEDMRKISAWVAIAAVPTLLAGIWGMNFTDMPELNRWWGYPLALILMAVISTVLYRRFRRSGWL